MATAADQVSAHAAEAGLADITSQHLPERDTARLRQAARLRKSAARQADKLIEAHAKTLGKAEAARPKPPPRGPGWAEAEQNAADKDADVEAAITATAETLSAWIQNVDERIRPSAETARELGVAGGGTGREVSPSPVLAMAISRDHLIPVRRPHEKRKAELDNGHERQRQGPQGSPS